MTSSGPETMNIGEAMTGRRKASNGGGREADWGIASA
jgi:hypothetical protein